MSEPSAAPILSVVIPVLNEEDVLHECYRRIKAALDQIELSYEMIFVDDGSTDGSRTILAEKALRDPTVRVVGLSRNFGQEMATTAGLHHARGQAAIIIDADLQDPPELMADFVSHWQKGFQVVYGVKARQQGESIVRKVTSFFFYRLMGLIGDVPIPRDTGDFRLVDRKVLDVFRGLSEDPRFFRGLVSWIGFKKVGVAFVRQKRAAGRTKYGYTRWLRLAFDTITAFSTMPAQLITILGLALAGLSGAAIAAVVVLWATGAWEVSGWVWAVLGFLILWNVEFLCIAMLGEYIVRMHRHTQRRPNYVVETVIERGQPT